jgi:uncharacterized membrane protein YesL
VPPEGYVVYALLTLCGLVVLGLAAQTAREVIRDRRAMREFRRALRARMEGDHRG